MLSCLCPRHEWLNMRLKCEAGVGVDFVEVDFINIEHEQNMGLNLRRRLRVKDYQGVIMAHIDY